MSQPQQPLQESSNIIDAEMRFPWVNLPARCMSCKAKIDLYVPANEERPQDRVCGSCGGALMVMTWLILDCCWEGTCEGPDDHDPKGS